MLVLFCADPLDPRQPDETYAGEVTAAQNLGLSYALINYEALLTGDTQLAVRRVPQQSGTQAGLYRGWMLKPVQYTQLYETLSERGIRLINDPVAYTHCHYLPESYAEIEAYTPRSFWIKMDGLLTRQHLQKLLRPFGDKPIIVKDFVKSQKHHWETACYIPSASDQETVERTVKRFLELQGDDLNEGLVFREFIELEPLTTHSRSGMPLTREYRLFVLDGEIICATEYWDEGDYSGSKPPLDKFREIARSIPSRFFTMDIAKRINDDWMVVELGDGQVAGLPDHTDITDFYRFLALV